MALLQAGTLFVNDYCEHHFCTEGLVHHMTIAEDILAKHLQLLSSSSTQMLSIHSDQTFYPASIYDLPVGDMGKKSMLCYIPEKKL